MVSTDRSLRSLLDHLVGFDRFAGWQREATSPRASWCASVSWIRTGRGALLEGLGEVAAPIVPLIGRSADPDQALAALIALADAVDDRERLLQEVADDEGTSMRLLSVLGASQALGDHLRRHPDHWHELCDPTLGSTRPPAYALRASLVQRPSAPTPTTPMPVATLPLGRGAGRPARGLPAAAPAAGLPRPGPPPRRRRRGRRARRPGRGHAGRRARRGARQGGGGRVVVPARGRSRWASAVATSSTTSATST